MIAEKAISKDTCNNFVKEIQKSKAFDDTIMGGRSRINKGSQNFKKFIKSSKMINYISNSTILIFIKLLKKYLKKNLKIILGLVFIKQMHFKKKNLHLKKNITRLN